VKRERGREREREREEDREREESKKIICYMSDLATREQQGSRKCEAI